MALFKSDDEMQRKENLRLLEDKRLRFAREMEARNFRPERMLFCSREDGSFVALARHEGRFALIEGPKLGTDDEFTLDLQDAPRCEREKVFEKGTGLNGAFGFGTKGARGFNLYVVNSDNLHVKMPVVFGRNSWLETSYRKNPLLKTKRRRGDANVMWDFVPIDSKALDQIEALLDEYYLAGAAAPDRGAVPQPAADSAAEAFYAALDAAIRREALGRRAGDADAPAGTRVEFGAVHSGEDCLSVVWHAQDDCELCFVGEGGQVGYHDEHLTQEQATEKCLSFLRKKKDLEEFMGKVPQPRRAEE